MANDAGTMIAAAGAGATVLGLMITSFGIAVRIGRESKRIDGHGKALDRIIGEDKERDKRLTALETGTARDIALVAQKASSIEDSVKRVEHAVEKIQDNCNFAKRTGHE